MVFILPAGKEAWHGSSVTHPRTRQRSWGRPVEHGCGDLKFWSSHGKDQEEPHPQSGWFQWGELPVRWPAQLASPLVPISQWVFPWGSSALDNMLSCGYEAVLLLCSQGLMVLPCIQGFRWHSGVPLSQWGFYKCFLLLYPDLAFWNPPLR
jgi:hypothetical protein